MRELIPGSSTNRSKTVEDGRRQSKTVVRDSSVFDHLRPSSTIFDCVRAIGFLCVVSHAATAQSLSKRLDALLDAAIDVALAEGLGGGAEDDDLVRPVEQRRLQALHVRRQHRIAHARAALHGAHHRVVVSHLRHPLRAHVARDLDLAQPGVLQAMHEFDLGLGRDRGRLVLQAVARADVDQRDARRQRHSVPSMRSSSPPSATWSPTA